MRYLAPVLAFVLVLVLIALLVAAVIFVFSWSPHIHPVTREDFGNGVSCYVWNGSVVSCERTP